MKKIAVFMLFGQSNAVGHAMPMEKEDYIDIPLKNVFGLKREPNQSYDTTELIFTGYTSFGMNLAETQDNTYSVANCLAKRWQRAIDSGAELPDLYIIHIAIGSQGLLNMWHPDREKVIKPGVLGQVDVSMYPLATHVLGLFNKFCKENDYCPDFVGLHWRGGEQEFRRSIDELEAVNLKALYIRFFNGLRGALGYNIPITLHKMPFKAVLMKDDPSGGMYETMKYINSIFEELSNELAETDIFDVTKAPYYDDTKWDFGIFRWDLIHYQGKTNDWVAKKILDGYKEKNNIKKYNIGLSTPGFVNEQLFANMARADIKNIEISVDRRKSEELDYAKLKEWSEKYGVHLWSFHLPFYPFDEIDVSKEEIAESSVEYLSGYIKKASAIGIDKFIIHASGEPIPEDERKSRMECAKKSLKKLCNVASEHGGIICVEDLPRTCLGRSSNDIMELLSADSRLKACLDTNHLLDEKIEDFIKKVGNKIVTTHISDYDFKNERHWLPGEGDIDWQSLIAALDGIAYDGVWLYEIDLAHPWTLMRDRELNCEDFANNADILFKGDTPSPIGIRINGLRDWKEN